ncbi:maltose ABC transporter permease MalF [Endozoicomonas sp.]|nr:maltose ABC transporter permease MalF [Endozoicomonas sp.]
MKAVDRAQAGQSGKWLVLLLIAVIDLVLMYGVTLMYAQGEMAFALLVLVLMASGTWVFVSKKGYNYRYIYPSILGVISFIVFPLIYTVNVAFTNFSSSNLLPLERVKAIHLSKTYTAGGESFSFKLYPDKASEKQDAFRLLLTSQTEEHPGSYLSDTFKLVDEPTTLKIVEATNPLQGNPLTLREVIKKRTALKKLRVDLPDGAELAMTSLRKFGAVSKIYKEGRDDTLIDTRTGDIITPDFSRGFYTTASGEEMSPGFIVYTGWDNFIRVITDQGIQKPFLKIFSWTVIFSALTVFFTLIIGLIMASLVQWEPMKGNGVYRLLLILPYAVPAFISILIFRGLFNQNFGEINIVLDMLLGVRPEWFSDELMAKIMVLVVNTWLGYPYIMILCIGLLKAVPDDLYEASAIDGASPIQNLLKITVPMIIKPLVPLLIASFAFNFNNLVLIALLTGGGPDILNAATPAGATDILVSYTFRIAFGSYGQDYGLASAIATVIFLMVGAIAWVNLKATRKFQAE